jgi:hypothetical protein
MVIDHNHPNAKSKIYIDSETCGLHSMMVLLQWAKDDGPIVLHDVWKRPVGETLDLIEWICTHTVVGFNLVFDWFHIVKIYTIFSLCPRDWIPEEHIEEIALLEPQAQDGPCVKPVNALDLLLHSRKGPYQSLMAREDIRIRRVPTVLAYALAQELEDRVQLDGIYFARSADKDAPRWQVFDIKNRDGDLDANFKDVVLRFNPAGGLKFLAEHAMGYEPKYHYKDVEPDKAWRPVELGYAPTALSVASPENNWEVWETKDGKSKLVGHAWPAVIKNFIEHWATREDAATTRLTTSFTPELWTFTFGCPTPGDDDSILACMVPVIRWRGFKINVEGMKTLLAKAQAVVKASPVNINKPKDVRAYLMACMDDTEKLVQEIKASTNKKNLEKLAKVEVTLQDVWGDDEDDDAEEDLALGMPSVKEPEHCTKCDGKPVNTNSVSATAAPVAATWSWANIPPPSALKRFSASRRRRRKSNSTPSSSRPASSTHRSTSWARCPAACPAATGSTPRASKAQMKCGACSRSRGTAMNCAAVTSTRLK